MPANEIGRPVRVTSISFATGKTREDIVAVVDGEGARGADLIALPETWLGQGDCPEPIDGPTITAMSALAAAHRTWIVCPVDRIDGERRLNSSVVTNPPRAAKRPPPTVRAVSSDLVRPGALSELMIEPFGRYRVGCDHC